MGNQACVGCQDLQQKKSEIDIDVIKKNSGQFAQNPQSEKIEQKPHQSHEERAKQQEKQQKIEEKEELTKPKLLSEVEDNLNKYKPFSDKLGKNNQLRKYAADIYEGSVNQNKQPNGYGIMYYRNGAVFVGQFENGIAQGEAHYILPNGSFYKGKMATNEATDENGYFQAKQFIYRGGVKKNKFEGEGKEKGKNYIFQGSYKEGKRVKGTLKWDQQDNQNKFDPQNILAKTFGFKSLSSHQEQSPFKFWYMGQFDEDGLFTGLATLISEKGDFEGHFLKGKKNGEGTFKFKNGLRYQGSYENDIKSGKGTIYSKLGKIAYSGEIKDGIPNGKGFVLNPQGEKVYMNWVDGISSSVESQ